MRSEPRQIECAIHVRAAPSTLFRIYEDVAAWHEWDPDTRCAHLDGPLRVGARGKLTPTQGNTVRMRVTDVSKDASFTVEAGIPLFRMRFAHELVAERDSTWVTHRVEFFGWLSPLIAPVIIRRLQAGLPMTLANLKALAELRQARATVA